MATVLDSIQSVAKRLGINSPNAVVSSQDPQIQQLLSLFHEEGQELAQRTTWQALTVDTGFTTLNTEIQGDINTIAPGMKFIINDTIWNRTLRMPVFGPLGPQNYQQQRAMYVVGPWSQYRIFGNQLHFYPIPAAGQDCHFEYVVSGWLTDSSNGNPIEEAVSDSDVIRLDYQLIILGVIWRWKAMKGLQYQEDFAKYERRVVDAIARDGSKPILTMDGSRDDNFPLGVFVPSGNWNV